MLQQFARPRSVKARIASYERWRQKRKLAAERAAERLEVAARHIAARQRRARRPFPRLAAKARQDLAQRMLRELAVGRELAAVDREQGRGALGRVDVEGVVARHR